MKLVFVYVLTLLRQDVRPEAGADAVFTCGGHKIGEMAKVSFRPLPESLDSV
jgi:hypothetical protein